MNLDSIGTWDQPAGPLLDIPGTYQQPALDLLAWAGVDADTFPESSTPGIPSSHGLRQMLLFPREDWGSDALVQNRFEPATPEGWAAFAARGPWSPEAQAVSAADCWLLGLPGFDGLGLGDPTDITFPGIGRTPQMGVRSEVDPTLAWPDGNSSLMRLVVSKLIPAAVPDVGGARPTQETVVNAKTDYSQLDRRQNLVRIRLKSFVSAVRPGRRGRPASVEYVRIGEGRRTGHRVRADHVIMACWNRVTAQIVHGLPDEQVEGSATPARCR